VEKQIKIKTVFGWRRRVSFFTRENVCLLMKTRHALYIDALGDENKNNAIIIIFYFCRLKIIILFVTLYNLYKQTAKSWINDTEGR